MYGDHWLDESEREEETRRERSNGERRIRHSEVDLQGVTGGRGLRLEEKGRGL